MYFGHLLTFPDVKLGFKYGLSSFVKIKKLLSHSVPLVTYKMDKIGWVVF